MLGIFDFDGTLFDTHDAVYAAYAEIGVTMPDDAWGKAWQEWLPACAPPAEDAFTWAYTAHSAKNVAMARHLGRVRPLPTMEELWRLARGHHDIYIMTGASAEAVTQVLHAKAPLLYSILQEPRAADLRYYTSMSQSAKLETMSNIRQPVVAYYDDHEPTCRALRRICPNWIINHVI